MTDQTIGEATPPKASRAKCLSQRWLFRPFGRQRRHHIVRRRIGKGHADPAALSFLSKECGGEPGLGHLHENLALALRLGRAGPAQTFPGVRSVLTRCIHDTGVPSASVHTVESRKLW
jgi:hypothetical protein